MNFCICLSIRACESFFKKFFSTLYVTEKTESYFVKIIFPYAICLKGRNFYKIKKDRSLTHGTTLGLVIFSALVTIIGIK